MSHTSKSSGPSPLVEFLAERDEACPSCKYSLRGLPSNRCPECHELLELRVGLVEPKIGFFIAGLVGLTSGAGFGGLLSLFGIGMILRNSGGPDMPMFFTITVGGFVIEGALALLWVRQRRRISRWSVPSRMLVVAGTYVLTLVNLVIFTMCIR